MKFKYLTEKEKESLMRDFLAQLEAVQLKDAVNNLMQMGQTTEQKIELVEKLMEDLKNGNKQPA